MQLCDTKPHIILYFYHISSINTLARDHGKQNTQVVVIRHFSQLGLYMYIEGYY